MVRSFRRAAAVWMLLALLLSLGSFPIDAEAAQPAQYSTSFNSGTRHELCTALSDGALAYYTDSYTYDILSSQTGSTLLTSLRELMTDTHTHKTSYSDCRDLAVRTDCQNGDGTISLLYTSYVATESDYAGGGSIGWNREHVWPKSLGGFKTTGAGADLHHIRPDDYNTNGRRGNLKYGNVSGGTAAKATIPGANGAIGGYYNSTYFEPLDNVKGDVARICLYVYVRYGGELPKCSQITNVFQSVDVLLEWCALDPVDTWEMGRNEVVGDIQGNRNVFIDYPELAWLLFNKEIPSDLVTPSHGSAALPCAHSRTEIRGAKAATCDKGGYTGDTYCADCGEKLRSGSVLPATGHKDADSDGVCDVCAASLSCAHSHTEVREEKAATCDKDGYSGDTYCADCGEKLRSGSVLPATGHKDGDSDGVCDICAASLTCAHSHTEVREEKAATCDQDGYSGDTYCADCGEKLRSGSVLPATGEHTYGEWIVTQEAAPGKQGTKEHTCTVCGHKETQSIPALAADTDSRDETPEKTPVVYWIIATAGFAAAAAVLGVVLSLVLKKRRH